MLHSMKSFSIIFQEHDVKKKFKVLNKILNFCQTPEYYNKK